MQYMKKSNMNLPNISSEQMLSFLTEQGIINVGDIQNILFMKKKEKVSEIHTYEIFQGKGKDKRWFTYIADESKESGRRKIAKQTETALYNYLYDLYFGNAKKQYENSSLSDVYIEWLKYKDTLANRSNYIRRIDCDYKKYYVNEPLSKTILTKPLKNLTKIDIETWAYAIIKKYKLTKKAYYNMSIILRQILEYMVDKEILKDNPYDRVKINTSAYRKVSKKRAETQVFFPDELPSIIECAYTLAHEKQDENYLAIPLFFRSGIRIGECLGLEYSDFHPETNSIYVHRSLVAVEKMKEDGSWEKRSYELSDSLKHNADPREILVVDECFQIAEKVREIQKSKGVEQELLFKVSTPAEIEYKLYSICDRLNILKRSTHKIRKTYISTLLNHQIDADFVREQAGHKYLKTTLDSYTYSTTRKDKKLELLNQALA